MTKAQELVRTVQTEFAKNSSIDISKLKDDKDVSNVEKILSRCLEGLDVSLQDRVRNEFLRWGPLESLLNDESITEIIVNSPDAIWIERDGQLLKSEEVFLSEHTYGQTFKRLGELIGADPNVENPTASGHWKDFRIQIIAPPIVAKPVVNFRRHPRDIWTIEKLFRKNWCSSHQAQVLKEDIRARKNILIIGPTGCGKTSVVNACLDQISENDRTIIIEDTSELALPNSASLKMVTRVDQQGLLKEITLTDLIRNALRLRPDRIVIGEVRGPEAKDLLVALSVGHKGCFGTLHASTAAEALHRLEILVQLGAPQWSNQIVRQIIKYSIDRIVVVGKEQTGERRLLGIYKICGLEDFGFLTDQVC